MIKCKRTEAKTTCQTSSSHSHRGSGNNGSLPFYVLFHGLTEPQPWPVSSCQLLHESYKQTKSDRTFLSFLHLNQTKTSIKTVCADSDLIVIE